MGAIDFVLALMQDMILPVIPAVGFAMVSNVLHRALPWYALLGAFGHGLRVVMMSVGSSIERLTFMASLLVGCIGIQWSRWCLAHPKVFIVVTMTPMFPGISAYTTMISVVKIGHFGYSEALMIIPLTNFLRVSPIVDTLFIGLSVPGL